MHSGIYVWWILLFLLNNTNGRWMKDNFINDRNVKDYGNILMELRKLMNDSDTRIDAYIIPMYDAHQSEYISMADKRLEYVTGFTGSQGVGVVICNKSAIWIDTRYHIQAEQQVDHRFWTVMKTGSANVPTFVEWLLDNLLPESRIGVDPFILSSSTYQMLSKRFNESGHTLVGIKKNLIDVIWIDRPSYGDSAIYPIELKYSGQTICNKVELLREKIQELNCQAIIITALDEVAWLLNLRGGDIPYNPVFFSYVILTKEKLYLFVHKHKLTSSAVEHLIDECSECIVRSYNEILGGIKDTLKEIEGKVLISSDASQAIYESVPDGRRIQAASVVARMKTIKNDVEANGFHAAHIRDGVAVTRYLHWLDTVLGGSERITELSGARKLEEFRSQQDKYKGLSFEAISAFGSNGALVHYSPTELTDRELTRDELYLIDSGGQYWDGTTDVTRTVHFGQPTEYEKECFTRVLQGFIAVITSIFPINTSLNYFDYVARHPLWQIGLNYGHGTGHGVGAFLNVHEYPPLLSAFSGNNPGALENMFTSIEPGYYKEGQFGIRIEDVAQIVKAESLPDAFDGNGALTFQTVTFVPIQNKMIKKALLTKQETNYINCYNQKVLQILKPVLLINNYNETIQWLVNETRPI